MKKKEEKPLKEEKPGEKKESPSKKVSFDDLMKGIMKAKSVKK